MHDLISWKSMIAALTLTLGFAGLGASSASGGYHVFVTPTASSTTEGPVNTEVDITTSLGAVSVTLRNLQANPTDVTQALSALSFTLAGGYAGATPSLTSSSGVERTIGEGGDYSDGSAMPTGWVLSSVGSALKLDDLADGGAGPSHLIVGDPGAGGLYSNAKGSIANNKPHNPFLVDSATFLIDAPGVTSSTTVSAATFSFGTTSGLIVGGIPGSGLNPSTSAVPEPAAIVSTLTGLGMAGVGAWRRRRRA